MSKYKLIKSLGVLLVVGVLVRLQTDSIADASSRATLNTISSSVMSDISATTDYVGLKFIESEFNEPGLDDPRAVVVSPDGEYVYVASYVDDAIVAYKRNSTTGRLNWFYKWQESMTLDGLEGAHAIAVSPDSKHVYVASLIDSAIVVFERQVSGLLLFVETEKDGSGGVDGLWGAVSVTVSPDGKHVYATGSYEAAVAIFERDSVTGALTYVGMVQDGVGGVEGLSGARSVVVSPDGKHVYVAGPGDDAIAVFTRSSADGTLTYAGMVQDGGSVDGLDGVYSIAIDATGSKVYAAGYEDDAVAAFSRNSTTGALTFLAVAKDGVDGVDGLNGARAVALSPDGTHCYAVGTADNAVVTLRHMTWPASFLYYIGVLKDEVNGVDGLAAAYSVAVSPDGKNVYTTGSVDDAVSVFSRDPATGALAYKDVNKRVIEQDNPRGVAVSPDGKHVYVASLDADAVVVFRKENVSGGVTFVEYKKNGEGGVLGLDGANSVVVSPDGKHVYVTSSFDDAVVIFARNDATGKLTYVGMKQDGVDGVDGLYGAHSVAISSDGEFVYVASAMDDALAFFHRDSITGDLTYWGAHKDGVFDVDGLDGAYCVAVSPDGEFVYVTGNNDDALAIFMWKEFNGFPVLSFLEAKKNNVDGVIGLNGAWGVAVSGDGRHVYVTGNESDALVDFRWNLYTGELDLFATRWDGGGGVEGLDGANSVAVNPITNHIYVAAGHNLAIFQADSTTGEPIYLGMKEGGISVTPGIYGAISVAVSPDSEHVYVVGITHDTLVVFERVVFKIYFPGAFNDFNPNPRPPR